MADDEDEILRRGMEIQREYEEYWNQRIDDYGSTTTFDIEFESIDEKIYLDYDSEVNIDDYWERGWSYEDVKLSREDSVNFSTELSHRIFPTRNRLKDFRLSKSLRRVINRNRDLRTVIRPLRVTPVKSALYEKHDKRFHETIWKPLQVKYPYPQLGLTRLMEACVFDQKNLVACSIFQEAKRGVYSDMAFWDDKYYDRSPGILTALLEMQYARANGFEFYYLGGYLQQMPIFEYKRRFPALEFYDWDNDRWIPDKTPEAERLLNQKLNFSYKKLDFDTYEAIFEIVASQNSDVIGLAIIGSYARTEARKDSDVDVIILTSDIEKYIDDATEDWARRFGFMREQRIEDSGAIKTIRAFYKNGHEFEFNFASPSWADINPLNEGTYQVIRDGMQILYDPSGILEKLRNAVLSGNIKPE